MIITSKILIQFLNLLGYLLLVAMDDPSFPPLTLLLISDSDLITCSNYSYSSKFSLKQLICFCPPFLVTLLPS